MSLHVTEQNNQKQGISRQLSAHELQLIQSKTSNIILIKYIINKYNVTVKISQSEIS